MKFSFKRYIFVSIILAVLVGFQSLTANSLSTPKASVSNFFKYMEKDSYAPEKAATSFEIGNKHQKDGVELVIKLKKILDSRGIVPDYNKIPDTPDYVDSISKTSIYTPFRQFPEIYLKKSGSKWLFSKSTLSVIPDLYDEIFHIESDFLHRNLPDFAFKTYIGLQLWQLVGLIGYLLFSYLIYKALHILIGLLFRTLISRIFFHGASPVVVKPVCKGISALTVIIIFSIYYPILFLPVEVNWVIYYSIQILIPLLTTLILYKATDLMAEIWHNLPGKSQTQTGNNIIPLTRKVIKVVIIVLGGVYLLKNLHIEITPILAGVSIGGIALALAAQDMIKNLFGSVTVYTDKPFEIGDWIIFDKNEGIVEEVGFRSTRIRTFYDSVLSIPNGKIADMVIDNMGRRKYRRYQTYLSVTYDTPPQMIEIFIDGLKRIIKEHEKTRKDKFQVNLFNLSESSIDIFFNIFFEVQTGDEELQARHELISKIMLLASHLGVSFAFPSRTLFIESLKSNPQDDRIGSAGEDNIKMRLESFFNKGN